ncbi:unnamed protein product [Lactuca virosa]|uniref:Peroxin-13 n=1 Tax=Lactuca virosa TaxID=75947 RepID=A0AAU9NRT6_9ASTR|nr:unnamed protein product [Lactuca virosa]
MSHGGSNSGGGGGGGGGGYGAYKAYVTTRYSALGAPTSYDYPGPIYGSCFCWVLYRITSSKNHGLQTKDCESSQNGISVDSCLTYENESSMKKEDTKWQKRRDIWWQMLFLNTLHFPRQLELTILTLKSWSCNGVCLY